MGEQQEQPLWVNVVNKQTGQPYKTIWNCTSMPRLDKEEPELAKELTKQFNEWLKIDGNKQLLKYDPENKEGCGFKTQIGDFEYKILEFTSKDGGNTYRTLGKRKAGKGGYGSGGRSYTLMRTVNIQLARQEEVAQILNNQGDNDNYEVVFAYADEQGPMFLVTKKEAYVPQAVTTAQKGESKDGAEEENSSEESTG